MGSHSSQFVASLPRWLTHHTNRRHSMSTRFPFAAFADRLPDDLSRDSFAIFAHRSPMEVVLGFVRDQEGAGGTLRASPAMFRQRPR